VILLPKLLKKGKTHTTVLVCLSKSFWMPLDLEKILKQEILSVQSIDSMTRIKYKCSKVDPLPNIDITIRKRTISDTLICFSLKKKILDKFKANKKLMRKSLPKENIIKSLSKCSRVDPLPNIDITVRKRTISDTLICFSLKKKILDKYKANKKLMRKSLPKENIIKSLSKCSRVDPLPNIDITVRKRTISDTLICFSLKKKKSLINTKQTRN
jgi:hypothetical protein